MKTEIIAITDRSGSMGSLRGDVIGGFNQFLSDQAAVPGAARMTYTQFDDIYEVLYQAVPIQEAPPLTPAMYVPRGSTALLDAIGRTLNVQGKRIHSEKWADQVIVCIITDGQENASREFTFDQIKDMIKHAEGHGWKFVFLAANQDAFAAAASYGISGQYTRAFGATSKGVAQAYADTSAMTTALRTQP